MNTLISPDVIVTWPSNCDYPLWRRFVRINRERFNKVIIVFHETNVRPDFRDFVMQAMQADDVTFITHCVTQSGHDWRDDAIKSALALATSRWVWFTEQDFTITRAQSFWEEVQTLAERGSDAIGILDGTRLHPCCLFVARYMLKNIKLDFGTSEKYDHFGRIQNELYEKADVGIIDADLYHHMNGLSHNLRLMFDRQEVTYKPDEFREYLLSTLSVLVPLSEVYVEHVTAYIKRTGNGLY